MHIDDTICALSTPSGIGAIAIIRISGKDATSVCDNLINFRNKKKRISSIKANTVHVGKFQYQGKCIDDIVVTLFQTPHSYTGEDLIEISCHGSHFIQQEILRTLIHSGARLARPGEFTQRAFLNGKLDLSQAEGVADLIASSSEAAHRLALNQMRGGFSEEINKLRNELLHFISLIELELDFSEEDVEFANRKQLSELVEKMLRVVTSLIQSFEYGNAVKNGIPVAIIGRTNSGKSTLLNRLLNEERAIVSEIAGTTRDFIEDTMVIQGIQFRFIDTAGLRHTTDIIETEGIARTLNKIKQASVIIMLADINDTIDKVDKAMSFLYEKNLDLSKKLLVFALNKSDTLAIKQVKEALRLYTEKWGAIASILSLSAKKGSGIRKLEELLVSQVVKKSPSETEIIVTNVRHMEALTRSSEALTRALQGLASSLPADLLAQDIREVIHYLGEITGEITNDEILENIFKNFCIGK